MHSISLLCVILLRAGFDLFVLSSHLDLRAILNPQVHLGGLASLLKSHITLVVGVRERRPEYLVDLVNLRLHVPDCLSYGNQLATIISYLLLIRS